MRWDLPRLTSDTAQGEYYLTDVVQVRRVAKLSKQEEQRKPRMMPLPAAFRALVESCGQG